MIVFLSSKQAGGRLLDLKTLSDDELLTRTEGEVRKEREILTSVLHHLREVDRRRLYSKLKYKSLFDFAVGHFKYDKDQAYRRIAAMKLLRDVPEIEESINKGELTLTHLNFAQMLFRQEKKIHNVEMSHEQKISVIEQITNKSTREAEVIMLSLSSAPEKIKPDRVRPITEKRIEMKFSANAEVEGKVERLKGMLAHKHPNLSLGELFEKLCDLGLEEWSPAKFAAPRKRRSKAEQAKAQLETQSKAGLETEDDSNFEVSIPAKVENESNPEALSIAWAELESKAEIRPMTTSKAKSNAKPDAKLDAKPRAKSCMIASPLDPAFALAQAQAQAQAQADWQPKTKSKAQIRREVFARANGRCENCSSTYALEIDHIRPQALGGPSTPDNLRILCRSCNQRAAIKALGIGKMERYLN